jgi:DNA invertase Pin-like site-specific DNA recombinase
MAFIGFARVSTQLQDLSNQVDRLNDAGCIKIFSGKHSGKAEANKEALQELLDYVREGDTVIVTKLDRLGRSLSQVLQVLDNLNNKNVNFIALDQNINTSNSDPMSKAMVQLLGMFSEMERNFIVSRTTEGKIASGNYGGRPSKVSDIDKKQIKKEYLSGKSISALSRNHLVSRATIGRIINK